MVGLPTRLLASKGQHFPATCTDRKLPPHSRDQSSWLNSREYRAEPKCWKKPTTPLGTPANLSLLGCRCWRPAGFDEVGVLRTKLAFNNHVCLGNRIWSYENKWHCHLGGRANEKYWGKVHKVGRQPFKKEVDNSQKQTDQWQSTSEGLTEFDT